MIKTVRDVYATYALDSERHRVRLIFMLIISTTLSVRSIDVSSSSFPNMIAVVSIIAGFTFTALFSNHALADADLPEPVNEDDRHDLIVLRRLLINFQNRYIYFIGLSVIIILFMVLLTIKYRSDDFPFMGLIDRFSLPLLNHIHVLFEAVSIVVVNIVFFLFLEVVYTFYRLSETILAIVRLRTEYLRGK